MDLFETHQNCLRELFHLRDIKRLGLTYHDLSHVSKLIARERKARRTGGEYHSTVLYLEKFCPTLITATLTVLTLVGASTLMGKNLARVLLHTHCTSCILISIEYSRRA